MTFADAIKAVMAKHAVSIKGIKSMQVAQAPDGSFSVTMVLRSGAVLNEVMPRSPRANSAI